MYTAGYDITDGRGTRLFNTNEPSHKVARLSSKAPKAVTRIPRIGQHTTIQVPEHIIRVDEYVLKDIYETTPPTIGTTLAPMVLVMRSHTPAPIAGYSTSTTSGVVVRGVNQRGPRHSNVDRRASQCMIYPHDSRGIDAVNHVIQTPPLGGAAYHHYHQRMLNHYRRPYLPSYDHASRGRLRGQSREPGYNPPLRANQHPYRPFDLSTFNNDYFHRQQTPTIDNSASGKFDNSPNQRVITHQSGSNTTNVHNQQYNMHSDNNNHVDNTNITHLVNTTNNTQHIDNSILQQLDNNYIPRVNGSSYTHLFYVNHQPYVNVSYNPPLYNNGNAIQLINNNNLQPVNNNNIYVNTSNNVTMQHTSDTANNVYPIMNT